MIIKLGHLGKVPSPIFLSRILLAVDLDEVGEACYEKKRSLRRPCRGGAQTYAP